MSLFIFLFFMAYQIYSKVGIFILYTFTMTKVKLKNQPLIIFQVNLKGFKLGKRIPTVNTNVRLDVVKYEGSSEVYPEDQLN